MSERSALVHAVHRLDVLAPDFDATGPDVAAAQFAYWRALQRRPPIGIRGPWALPLTFRRRVPAGS